MNAQDDVKNYLSLIAEEYKALRDEIKQANSNMFLTFQFGSAALAGVISAALTQWNNKHIVVLLLFFVVVPAICGMTMILWLGEAARFKRAGDYIYFIEDKVGMILDDFKSNHGIKKKWEELQARIEKNLCIKTSTVDLSDPIVWEHWLRDNKGKSITDGHFAKIYFARLLFFAVGIILSLIVAIIYLVGVTEAIGVLKEFNPIPEAVVLVFFISVGLGISISTMWFAYNIASKLNVKQQPTGRTQSEK